MSFRRYATVARRLVFCAAVCCVATSSLVAVEIDGFTEPYRDVDISSPEAGLLVEVLVKEGEEVKAGTPLARIDDDGIVAAQNIARAEMEALGRLHTAQAELKYQEDIAQRMEDLHKRDHATQQELDRARLQLEISRSELRGAEEDLQLKRLEVKRLQTQIERRRLISPIDGVVVEIKKEIGESVTPNDASIVRVVQLHPLLVVFSVPYELTGNLTKDQDVVVEIDGISATGSIEYVSPIADPQSGTRRVKVLFPNADGRLPSGASCLWNLE